MATRIYCEEWIATCQRTGNRTPRSGADKKAEREKKSADAELVQRAKELITTHFKETGERLTLEEAGKRIVCADKEGLGMRYKLLHAYDKLIGEEQ